MSPRIRWVGWTIALLMATLATACTRISPSSWPGVTVEQDTLYVAYQQQVYALRLPDGQPLWQFPPEPNRKQTFFAAPVRADNLLVVGGYDNVLYGLDPANGTQKWTFDQAQDRYIASPLLVDGVLYAPNADGTLYVLDRNGQLKWTFTTQAALWAQPVLAQDRLYLASMDHHLYALNPKSGQVEWQVELPGALPAPPVVTDDRIFMAALAPVVTALSPEDGRVLWQQTLRGWVWHQPFVADDHVIVADMQGYVYALDGRDGTVLWERNLEAPIAARPARVKDTLYVATRTGDLVALDWATGQVRWRRTVEELAKDGFAGPLTVLPDEEGLITPTMNAKQFLIVWSLDGQIRWTFPAK
ncbi:MAG: PQQ-binding-like beta-propeller repeat protein [Chloroflexi bacterium]|nr:PQQ-binding-like beta-propeller repeat protein [Chloroflexota bacterium]